MNIRPLLLLVALSAGQISAVAQREDPSVPGTMNLNQAVELALKHNHVVRLASLKIEEDEHAKDNVGSQKRVPPGDQETTACSPTCSRHAIDRNTGRRLWRSW